MTTAPRTLVTLQTRLTRALGTVNLGIVGDAAHVATGGYHIGAQSLRANGMGDDYSLQFPIDRDSTTDYACAVDIGGSPELLITIGNRIVDALKRRDPRVYNRVRAVNAAFDGSNIDRRYDTESPNDPSDDNTQACSDRNHLHAEFYRTLVLDQSVMDGFFDVLTGKDGFVMDADAKARFDAIDHELQALRNLIVGNQERLIADLKLDRAQSAHDNTEKGN